MNRFKALNKMEEFEEMLPEDLLTSENKERAREIFAEMSICGIQLLRELNESIHGGITGITLPFLAAVFEYQAKILKNSMRVGLQKKLYTATKNILSEEVQTVRFELPKEGNL